MWIVEVNFAGRRFVHEVHAGGRSSDSARAASAGVNRSCPQTRAA